jgi:hypothetical protein
MKMKAYRKLPLPTYRDHSLSSIYTIISKIIHVWFWNNANAFNRLPYAAKIYQKEKKRQRGKS